MSWLSGTGLGYPYWLGNNPQPQPYGSFLSTQDQTVTGANTTTILTYNTTVASSQTYSSGGRIYVQATGLYIVQFTIQCDTSSGGSQVVRIWFRKNGALIANTSAFFTIANNAENIATSQSYVFLLAGDYIEVVFQSPDANMTAETIPAGGIPPNNYPVSPSIITNIIKIA